MTAIVTACYGGFDTVRGQVAQDVDVTWWCFTDDPDLPVPAPWRLVVEPSEFPDPRMAAKVHKMRPRVGDDDVIWMDASHEVTSPAFAREALAARRGGIAAFRHPRRDCVYEEARASVGAESQGGKYAGQPIAEQARAYWLAGHPHHGGLFACGVVAWDLAVAGGLGEAWLAECRRWTVQDQLSLPVVARRLGVTPGVFPVAQIEGGRNGYLENRWLRIHPHR